jgi:hypothetical protein
MRRTTNALLALALAGSLLWGGAPSPVYGASRIAPASTLLQQTPEPVFALPGTLGRALNQNFATFLLTSDGKAYALVGETPAIEQEIAALRDQGAAVQVWGTLYPQGRVSATPEIVVSNVLQTSVASPQPTPAPQPTTPTATVRNASINIRTGPGTNYESIGLLNQGDACTLTGRDPANTWWQVQCLNGLSGWILQQLVDVVGNTASVPVAPVPPPPPPPAPPPQPPTFYGWKAEFFPNRDLSGPPATVQDVPDVNFNWGGGGPPGVPVDNFSARFTRTINFNPGTYRFRARSDDGVRVFIDDQPIIDQWFIQSATTEYTADRSMYGNQTVRIEYFEADGNAELYFSFAPLSTSQTIDGGGSGEWQASYFNNTDLAGNPVLVRREPRSPYPLDVDWGNGSPAAGIINNDNFSARWVGTFNFDAGDYVFQARSDDGVRVYIDGIRVIDAWTDGYKEPSNRFQRLGGGDHQITIEYYERGGTAFNRVWWWRDSGSSGGSSSGGGGLGRDN